MADDLKYGYKGAEPTQTNINNTGVFSVNEINDLLADNKWVKDIGDLVLLDSQTADNVSTVDFFDISESTYRTHIITCSNISFVTNNVLMQMNFREAPSTVNTTNSYRISGWQNYVSGEGDILDNASEYSFGTVENTTRELDTNLRGIQGGYVHTVAQACDGIQFFYASANITSGTFTLYKVV